MEETATRSKRRWVSPAFAALLIATGALYFYNLAANGYGNEFYAAAAQAGTKSWKAFLFGSSDWSNAITVDKTPAFLWPQEIFGRIFGFNSWSMLAPQVLEAVGSVALLYAAIKRWFGPAAGLLAGTILAITPVAALMFRFNNPDAALTFLLVAGAYCATRAIESPKPKWMVMTGVCLGFAFLAKELQALLVVPAFAFAYLVAAPISIGKRVANLLAGLGAMLVSAGWWIALALLWPAASRPYFGGSTHNSILQVILGGNGVSRLTGQSSSSGGGGMGANFSGASGWNRLFNDLMGGQISWLIPAAVIALFAGLVMTLHTRRTNYARAGLLLWGGWFAVTAVVFSFMNGIVHTYYTVALAPAIAAVLGIVCTHLWTNRTTMWIRATLAAMVATTAAWSYTLLGRTPDWLPQLRLTIAALAVITVLALLAEPFLTKTRSRIMHSVATVALAATLLGPFAYTLQTISTAHHGSIPSAGPTVENTISGFGGGPTGIRLAGAQLGGGNEATADAALVSLLKAGASGYTWAAATTGSQSSATLQLSAGVPVMSMGGFNGGDPYPTLAQFKAYVAAGKIHYFVAGGAFGGGMAGGMGGPGGGSSEITSWVESTFASTTVGGQNVYDLTPRK